MPRSEDLVLAADGVGIRFPRATVDAVHDVSVRLRAGERLAILGRSGSGKTSLALALLGAIPALVPAERRGSVRWTGLAADGLATGNGIAAAVLQDTDAQLVALTVEDEIAFALENRGLPSDVIDARIAYALSRPPGLGLSRRDRTLTLSGGWRQRLALASALAEEASTLVIDEPVAHLDGEAAAEAVAALGAACADGAAAILVEHRIDHIVALAETVLVLGADGGPAAFGQTEATLRAIANDDRHGLRLPAEIRIEAALARAGLAPSDSGALAVALRALGFDRRATGSAGAPFLRIEEATLRRGGRVVLDRVSLSVGAGEVVGLIGRNGAGKTSLGLLAAGALAASSGAVTRDGEREPIYVPQNPALAFASASLEDEALRRGLAWVDAAAAIADAGLPADRGRHPLAFSHGERRRLALALAAAAPRQRVIVLDEPVSGLDALGLKALDRMIASLRASGAAILVVAHDLDWLGATADRIAIVEAGRIVAEGDSRAVLAQAVAGRLPLPAPPAASLAARLGWTFGRC